MSIYEYDQEEHIRLEREDAFADGHKLGREQGREEGREEGRKLGEYKKLKELVAKKVEKGLTVPEIAEVLEESVGRIQDIVEELGKRMI